MKIKIFFLFILLFTLSLTAQDDEYTIASASASGVQVYLEQGEHTITYISGAYKYSNSSSPYNTTTTIELLSDPLISLTVFEFGIYATESEIESNFEKISQTFYIAEAGTYKLYRKDPNYNDNSGSMTISLSSACGSCTNGGCAKELGSNSSSIQNGKSIFDIGTASGNLKNILPKDPTGKNISSPEYIYHSDSGINNEELIKDSNDDIKQIKNDKGLTQIDVIDADSYTVKQYSIDKIGNKDSNGNYIITDNTPDTIFTFSKTSATPNKLNIKTEKGGTVLGNTSFNYDSVNSVWIHGEDFDGDNVFDRYQYELSSISGNDTIKTSYVEDSSNTVVSEIKRTYDANENLTKEQIDPNGINLTTEFQYDSSDRLTRTDYHTGGWETITYTSSGEQELVTRSSGLFTKYEYDSSDRVIKIIESFNNSTYTTTESDHKVTTYDYTPVYTGDDGSVEPDSVRTVTVFLQGNAVSKTYYGYLNGEQHTVQAASPTATISDTNNLISSTYYNNDDEIIKTVNPDGTGSIITYSNSGSTVTTTTEAGVFNTAFDAIVEGIETVEVVTDDLLVSTHTFDIDSSLLISSRVVTERDSADREKRIDYHDGTYEMFIYNCCNLDSYRSREGIWTDYTYDSLKRQITSTSNGIMEIITYDAMGNIEKREQQGTDNTLRTLIQNTYDASNRLISSKDALNNQTTYSETYNSGQTTSTTSYPDGTTEITVTDSEGRLVSLSGTAVFPQGAGINEERVENDTSLGYYVLVQRSGETNNWVDSYTDALGRVYKTVTSSGAVSESFYEAGTGRLIKSKNADGSITLYYEDPSLSLRIEALDVNQNDTIDYGTDSITRVETDYYENASNIIYQRTKIWTNPASLNSPGAADSINEVSNDGLARVNTSVTNGISSTFQIQSVVSDNGVLTTTATRPDGSYSKTQFTNGLQDYEKSYDSSDNLLHEVTFTYDIFNRLSTQTDSRNGTSSYSYNLNDRVLSLTTSDPDGDGPQTSQTFSNTYNSMGRRSKVSNPDNTEINFEYTTQGLIKKSYGDNVYPREYIYDSEGQLKNIKTWKDYNAQTGDNQITWTYNDQGQLLSETDKLGRVTSYTYYSSGLLHTKVSPRGITKTYSYDSSGRLLTITYSDTTPSITFTYNERGQLDSVSDELGSRTYNYNTLGQFTGLNWNAGAFNGVDLTYSYDSIGRQQSFVRDIGTQQKTVSYDYDDFGRLAKVTRGSYEFEYSYLTDSPNTVERMSIKKNSAVQIYSIRQFDKIMRTKQVNWFSPGQ